MNLSLRNKNLLGINGLGRIGKLLLWNQIHLKHYEGIVVNCGREVGKTLDDLIQVIETDSTYGSLHKFLFGMVGRKAQIKILDADKPILEIEGIPIKILRTARDPKDINWLNEGVKVVVDCTGSFLDPTVISEAGKPCLRGHLDAGALKVICSAPFKIKGTSQTPSDAKTMIYGINHLEFNPAEHHVISAASCTTTGLSHMIKPLLENSLTSRIVTASMSTIHASTNTQSILDSVPKAAATDLRKSRSVINNVILSTTGAAKALELVMPEIKHIGFMADSVRIPTNTVSLINLNVTFYTQLDALGEPMINRKLINEVYASAAKGPQKDLLVYSERQNVSADLIGTMAAITIEAHETHTRTGFINFPPEALAQQGFDTDKELQMPVTHAKIFGWYDNELGSYVNCLSKLTNYVFDKTV
ncbi:MAG: glyceraldehyde 3-phosphate dehydrogenase NAD-binding domain-containing protein [Candidatus Cloacimonetes bacterium]|jgi:glyceraldehyde 3-phosphate dehydrogenase|nr:glyceraldehyde 3-phosphate dehydrogenase NAD-binding domain-containing protein [Candidatus Cloacimonadota bacterium]MDD3578984.1 glyceraldehyde 3-phosphate dehydrogenase NAD-binding domain-containing protein [Candidatus Cloacimonadota bacterium]MDD4667304.1 glyceraldehyde 3-phosphate dehydrogenase NAD-binding domain-containing protein [Candidatus Cloacimonadota bacterium]MDY0337294.1 glyceraldehyde 3-phosphate dehydrogenase NAD-binding domain-containing protein [Candidatus Cloacimonadaceae ba